MRKKFKKFLNVFKMKISGDFFLPSWTPEDDSNIVILVNPNNIAFLSL